MKRNLHNNEQDYFFNNGYNLQYSDIKYPLSTKEKILGAIFILVFIAEFALIVYFNNRDDSKWIIFMIAFVVEILIAIIVVTTKEKLALKKPKGDYNVQHAKVLGCGLSSVTTTSTFTRRKMKVVYKVLLLIGDKKIKTYSTTFLPKDKNVTVLVGGGTFKHYYIRVDSNNNMNNTNNDNYNLSNDYFSNGSFTNNTSDDIGSNDKDLL